MNAFRSLPVHMSRVFVPHCCTRVYSSRKRDVIVTQPTSDQYLLGYNGMTELEKLPQNIRRTFELGFANKSEWNKLAKSGMISKLQEREGDTGSAPVQVGALTVRIHYLTDHMRRNRKDKSCLRRLLHLVQKRRKLLVYLRTANFTRYHTLLEELNLRPVQDSKYGYIKKE